MDSYVYIYNVLVLSLCRISSSNSSSKDVLKVLFLNFFLGCEPKLLTSPVVPLFNGAEHTHSVCLSTRTKKKEK